MTNRIRIIVAALAAVLGVIAASGPAHAGPDRHYPATTVLSAKKAETIAGTALARTVVVILPRPAYGKVGKCAEGPKLWKCSVWAGGADTTCRATAWVWRDKSEYYFEFHNLRCDGRIN